jgi:hypothetical protein
MLKLDTLEKRWERASRYWSLPVMAVSGALVTLINVTSLIPFFYFLLLAIVVYGIAFRRFSAEVIMLYGVYSLLSIGIFLIQHWTLPEFYGFSGGVGIGTDDCRFYQQAAANPPNFPSHCYQIAPGHSYSVFIRALSPLGIYHPLDVIWVNVVGSMLTPLFVREAAKGIFNNTEIAFASFLFASICPFLLSNSIILIRDGWTATLLIGGIYFLLEKRYVILLVTVVLLFYLRVASGAMALGALVFVAWLMYREARVHKFLRPLLLGTVVGVIALVALYAVPIIWEYVLAKGLAGGFFREEFAREYVMGTGSGRANPAMGTLLSQPWYIRIPLSTAFFSILPTFELSSVVREGVFIPRSLMASVAYPLLFIFYINYLARGLHYALSQKDINLIAVAILFFGFTLAVSQLSLQARHKTMIMPLMYLLVGYGYVNHTRNGKNIGIFVSIVLVIATLLKILVL